MYQQIWFPSQGSDSDGLKRMSSDAIGNLRDIFLLNHLPLTTPPHFIVSPFQGWVVCSCFDSYVKGHISMIGVQPSPDPDAADSEHPHQGPRSSPKPFSGIGLN